MASSSSSPKREFDVFVSFRGDDTRYNFTGYLLDALKRRGIDAFFDNDLRRGNDISVLFERIQQSKMSIVVFSKNYANSVWCLDEILKIIQCRETSDHRVIPVFYKVKKSDVEGQKGSFEAYFLKHEETFKEEAHKVEKWKDALKAASNISGFVYDVKSPENEFVENIVMEALQMLDSLSPPNFEGYPGVERRSKELEELLMFNNNEGVRIIGVLGMAGIGKTMVVESVYKQNCRKFDGYEFIYNVHEDWKVDGKHLHEKLLGKILDLEKVDIGANGRYENCVRNKKLFIVLDNVTNRRQLEVLIGEKALYRKGSRIVIITRDKKLLQNYADVTYVLPGLNDKEAMELFCLNAFSDSICPPEEFVDLSKKFVNYCKGHPSALKHLGSYVLGKEEKYWENTWVRLMVRPDNNIQEELQLSYNALKEDEKRIFLDIACFFKSDKEAFVSNILASDDGEAMISRLQDKCFVNVSCDRLEMHDLMHIMGKYIGNESTKRLGDRSRLRNHRHIRPLLEQNTGTDYGRGILLNLSNVKRIELRPDAFVTLKDLKFLKFLNSQFSQWCDDGHTYAMLTHLPDTLVYLHWQWYPYRYLPSEFNPEDLFYVHLRYSNIRELWENKTVPKYTENLRWVDLSHSKDLLNLSGLSRAKNLEILNLEGCTSLDELGPSIEQMHELVYLNLRDCTSLESLPKGINLKSLKTLILSGCYKLQDFQIISESIESLDLQGTAIEQVVEHIESLHNLILLNLKNCSRLKYLPDDLYKMKCLQELILTGCSALESLPSIKEEMGCLEILRMDGTSIKHTPEMIYLSNLKVVSFCESSIKDSTGLVMLPFSGSSRVSEMYLTNCNIKKLPDNFSFFYSLRCLCLSRNNIETLPESIEKIYSLLLLDLKHCLKLHSLPVLPSNLQCLDAHGCVSLNKVAKPVTLPLVTEGRHTTFIFTDCFKLDRAEQEDIVAQAQLKSQLLARTSLQHNQRGLAQEPLVSVCFPGSDIPSWFSHQRMGSSIETELLPHWCHQKFIGASLCVVVTFKDQQGHLVNHLSVRCKCQFKNQNGQTISFSFRLGGWNESCGSPCHEPRIIGHDHVFISHNHCNAPVFEWSEKSDNSCHPTSASFEFYLTDETERKLECCKVTRCGMSLLYAPDENDRGFQGIRVTDNTDQRTSSEALVTIRGQSHSRIEEIKNGIKLDEYPLMSVISKTRGSGF